MGQLQVIKQDERISNFIKAVQEYKDVKILEITSISLYSIINNIKQSNYNNHQSNPDDSRFNCEPVFSLNNFKSIFESFLPIKSLVILSSTSKFFYGIFRQSLYSFLYINIILSESLIYSISFKKKILRSIYPSFSSPHLKNKSLKEISELYNIYSTINFPNEFTDIIIKDLTRTFPKDPSFLKGNVKYKKLLRILTAFSNSNKEIGYAQGLNYICASAMFFFQKDEEIFLFLDAFVNKFKLNEFMRVDDNTLLKKVNIVAKILEKHCSVVVKHLKEKFLNHEFFSAGWIITLFSNQMEKHCLKKVWAFMIIFGWKFFYCLIIEVLNRQQDKILSFNETNLCNKMKELVKEEEFVKNFNEIIQNTLNFMRKNIAI